MNMPDFPRGTGGATANQVWAYASRTMTSFTGQPRTDILGEDATFESGSGSRKTRIDTMPSFAAPTESSVSISGGTEITLVELSGTMSRETEVWLDLTTMNSGDSVTLNYYRTMKSGGSYALYATEDYTGQQSQPAQCILSKKIFRSVKVTGQQTSGDVGRTLDVQIISVEGA